MQSTDEEKDSAATEKVCGWLGPKRSTTVIASKGKPVKILAGGSYSGNSMYGLSWLY